MEDLGVENVLCFLEFTLVKFIFGLFYFWLNFVWFYFGENYEERDVWYCG